MGLCDRCVNPAEAGYRECKECRQRSLIRRRKIKEDVIKKYGGMCLCCSESRLEFLTIDHINGGGSQHRKAFKNHIYPVLNREPASDAYRVLCMNCNLSLGLYGYCPHKYLSVESVA